MEEIAPEEQKISYTAECDETDHADGSNSFSGDDSKRKASFLYGTAAVCFILASVTFWFDKIILPIVLPQLCKLLYVTMFTCLGVTLAVLDHYTNGVVKQSVT